MVMLARLVQLEKADSPMVVTLLGIITLVMFLFLKPSYPLKALFPIPVTG
jgi:hypothetical protein